MTFCLNMNKEYGLPATFLHKLTFTNCCFSIKNTSSAATISSASPCVVTNQNKPNVTTVVSHGIESIVAVFIRSRTTVCHRAIGRSSQGRTGYSYMVKNEANESVSLGAVIMNTLGHGLMVMFCVSSHLQNASPSKTPVVLLSSPVQVLVLLPTRTNPALQLWLAMALKP